MKTVCTAFVLTWRKTFTGCDHVRTMVPRRTHSHALHTVLEFDNTQSTPKLFVETLGTDTDATSACILLSHIHIFADAQTELVTPVVCERALIVTCVAHISHISSNQ